MNGLSNPPVKFFGSRVFLEQSQEFFYPLNVVEKDFLWHTHHSQVARLQLPLSEKHGLPPAPTGIGTLSFDTQQELLWIGTDSVSRSHYTLHLVLTSFLPGPNNLLLWLRPTEIHFSAGASDARRSCDPVAVP